MAKTVKKARKKAAKRAKSSHKWKRAPGGWKCTQCLMFKSFDRIFYPVGKPAIDGNRRKTEPKCEPKSWEQSSSTVKS